MNFMLDGEFGNLPKPLQYIYNLGVCFSRVLSTFLGGDPDETLSSRTGKAIVANKWFAVNVLGPFIDTIFFDKGHCLKSIELDEGSKQIWDWSK
jgi:hypothetical protein